jgi:hypothetical protein
MPRTGRPRKDDSLAPVIPIRRKATTPEGREQQLVGAAIDLAEKQIAAGTASAQVITHYLKLGSSREALEQERIRGEVELQKAKIEQMASSVRVEEMYREAMLAMRSYQGAPPLEIESEVVDDELY